MINLRMYQLAPAKLPGPDVLSFLTLPQWREREIARDDFTVQGLGPLLVFRVPEDGQQGDKESARLIQNCARTAGFSDVIFVPMGWAISAPCVRTGSPIPMARARSATRSRAALGSLESDAGSG